MHVVDIALAIEADTVQRIAESHELNGVHLDLEVVALCLVELGDFLLFEDRLFLGHACVDYYAILVLVPSLRRVACGDGLLQGLQGLLLLLLVPLLALLDVALSSTSLMPVAFETGFRHLSCKDIAEVGAEKLFVLLY